jgi:hypothetical protein
MPARVIIITWRNVSLGTLEAGPNLLIKRQRTVLSTHS